jgi:hypothetical protein
LNNIRINKKQKADNNIGFKIYNINELNINMVNLSEIIEKEIKNKIENIINVRKLKINSR